MKDFYICDCARHENQTITSFFVVAVKQVKTKKSGELYLSLMLADRSGQVQANMWENVGDAIDGFEQDDFVKVKGIIHKYNGRWQITVHKVRKLGDREIDYSDYLPKTTKDVEELWRNVAQFVDSFENHWLKTLLRKFMADDAIAAAYKSAPAAKTLHHAFVGGLLDHVVSLLTVCDLAARNYPQVNRDLLLTGAFLHDIGKIHELTYQRSISYTTKGQLLGHMIIELGMLQEKIAKIDGFPDDLRILIEHMIISHHGQYEFGSPKLPMFPEALMLHYMDDLDSKMEAMRAQFEREADLEAAWTNYNPSLGRPLLNTRKFLDKKPPVAHPDGMAERPLEVAVAQGASAVDGNGSGSHQPIEFAATVPQELVEPTAVSGEAAETHNDRVKVAAPASPAESPLEALQRKFAAQKLRPADGKLN